MKKALFLFTLTLGIPLFFLPKASHSTSQQGDTLIYQGETLTLQSEPLREYLAGLKKKPEFVSPHTANWRGYLATWEIKDNTLYLKDFVGYVSGGKKGIKEVGLKSLFPKNKAPIVASWFSGMIAAPQGKMLNYVHMGYESTYEKTLKLTIENGKVVKTEVTDNRARDR